MNVKWKWNAKAWSGKKSVLPSPQKAHAMSWSEDTAAFYYKGIVKFLDQG